MTIPTPTPPNYLDDGAAAYAPTGGGPQTGFGQVAGAPAQFYVGAGAVTWNGAVVLNVAALNTATGDELYQLEIQGSSDPTFAHPQTLGLVTVAAVGQYAVAVSAFTAGVLYPYFRLAKHVSGTAPSIALNAFPLPFSGMDDMTAAEVFQLAGLASQNLTAVSASVLAWASGAPSGGPNGDGRYPLYDASGSSFLVLCPAASGGLTAALLDALPLSTGAEASPNLALSATDPTSGARVLKRLNFFPGRRTVDLAQRTLTVASDLLQLSASADGTPYAIPISILQSQLTGVFNVKDPVFGAKGDYREVRDGVSSANNIFTSATNPWTSGDLGKLVYIGDQGNFHALVAGTITAVNSTGEITVSASAGYSATGLTIGWGTDDTAAIAACLAAAAPPFAFVYGGAVVFPPGAYLTDGQVVPTRTALYGYGGRISFLVRKPSSSNQATLSNSAAGTSTPADFPVILNVGIYGAKTLSPGFQRGYNFVAEPGNFTYPQGDVFPYWQGMQIWECTDLGFGQSGNAGGIMIGCQINDCATYGYKTAAFDMDISDLYIQGCSLGGLYTFTSAAGNNYSNCKISFNGQSAGPGSLIQGFNILVGGGGETFTNVRGQESYYSNWVIQGGLATIRGCRAEDTGDIGLQDGLGQVPSATQPRAAVQLDSASCVDNNIDIEVIHAIPSGHSTNCATHALFVSGVAAGIGTPTYNRLQLHTMHTMAVDSSYWQGGVAPSGRTVPVTTGVYAPAVHGTDNTGGVIDPSNSDFKINNVQIA